jgi:hypothetical protein
LVGLNFNPQTLSVPYTLLSKINNNASEAEWLVGLKFNAKKGMIRLGSIWTNAAVFYT